MQQVRVVIFALLVAAAAATPTPLALSAHEIAPWDPSLTTFMGWCYQAGRQWDDFSQLNLTAIDHFQFQVATPELCQAECYQSDSCVEFTWWNNTGDCFLGTVDGNMTPDEHGTFIESITGPKVCPNTGTTTSTLLNTTTTTTTTTEAGGFPWWGWLLIVLGVLGGGGAIAAAVLMNNKEPPKKKKTRAIKPAPAPVETKTEPVPTYTRVIPTYTRAIQVAPVPQVTYAAPMMTAPVPPVTYAAPMMTAPVPPVTYAAPMMTAYAAPGSMVLVR